MTLAELKRHIDGLVALGYGDEEVTAEPDEGWVGAEPVPPFSDGDPGVWYVADVVPSGGEGWVALRYRYRPAAVELGS